MEKNNTVLFHVSYVLPDSGLPLFVKTNYSGYSA
jgi:hypothetical protein